MLVSFRIEKVRDAELIALIKKLFAQVLQHHYEELFVFVRRGSWQDRVTVCNYFTEHRFELGDTVLRVFSDDYWKGK